MIIKTENSRSYKEILDYLSFVFPEQNEKIQEENHIEAFALKWNKVYTNEYRKLIESDDESVYSIDAQGKKFTCENMAMLTVFNAISDEFGD